MKNFWEKSIEKMFDEEIFIKNVQFCAIKFLVHLKSWHKIKFIIKLQRTFISLSFFCPILKLQYQRSFSLTVEYIKIFGIDNENLFIRLSCKVVSEVQKFAFLECMFLFIYLR